MRRPRKLTIGALAGVACVIAMYVFVPRQQPPHQPDGTRYLCCQGMADQQDVLAGETIVLRWTVVAHQPGADPVPAELNASLIGPFNSYSEALLFETTNVGPPPVVQNPRVMVSAVTLHADGDPTQQLEHALVAPSEGGHYRLVSSATYHAKVTVSGGAVVRIAAISS